jgi:uncharacterized phage protein (TIGR01671 family)
MNRVIKFRAWDERTKKMFYSDENQTVWAGGLEISVNSNRGKINGDFIGMQFTGLTDKNGKEIFEGDFVREKTNPCSQNKDCIVEPDPLYDRYEIKWDERRNGWNAFPNTSLSPEDFNIAIQQLGGLITWPSEDVLQNSWHYEIIGNIYDNPELLKQ